MSNFEEIDILLESLKTDKFKEVSRRQLIELICELRDQASPEFFSVLFIRRHGKEGMPEERFMRCSFNIYKYLRGGLHAYDPSDYNLFHVADIDVLREGLRKGEENVRPYRSINLEGLLAATIRGVKYKVVKG